MKLTSKRGTFASLQELRGAYLSATDRAEYHLDPYPAQGDDWEDDHLHISELARCPRAPMLRFTGAPKRVRAPLTIANEEIMFWIGYRLHYLTYSALNWAGLLVSYEQPLFDPPWAGRADAFFRPDYRDDKLYGLDVKSYRPRSSKYAHTYPKKQDVWQVSGYATTRPGIGTWVIEYIAQGGSTAPVECLVDPHELHTPVTSRMAMLEELREDVLANGIAAAPPPLPSTFVAHYRKARGRDEKELVSITIDSPWECSYCPYCHTEQPAHERDTHPPLLDSSPCRPDWHPPLTVAKRVRGTWHIDDHDGSRWNDDELRLFMDSQLTTIPLVGGQNDDK